MPTRRTQSEAFRVWANNPAVARVAISQLIRSLENNKFDTRLRELMIMRIGWVTGSAYEWTQHWRVATTAGIPPEDVLAVRDWRNSERLMPADKAILAATDECLAGKSISDAAWAEVAKHVTEPAQQVEFIIAMGNWMTVSSSGRIAASLLSEDRRQFAFGSPVPDALGPIPYCKLYTMLDAGNPKGALIYWDDGWTKLDEWEFVEDT